MRAIRGPRDGGEWYFRAERMANCAVEWLAATPPSERIGRVLPISRGTAIVDLRKVLRAACAAAGVPYFQPKQVRTMVENRLFDAGADPDVVSAQLGHTPEVSLRNYRKAKARRINEVLEGAGLGQRPATSNVVSLTERRRTVAKE